MMDVDARAKFVQVIQDHTVEFLQVMNAKEIAPKLKELKVIPESVKFDILQSKSKELANVHLLHYLKEDAAEEAVKEVFRIASAEECYGRMNTFAAVVLKKLRQGVSRGDDVSQAASQSTGLKRKKVSSADSGVSRGDDISQTASQSPELKRKKVSSVISEPITEAVTEGDDKSAKEKCRSSTEEAGPSSDQKAVARHKIEEEVRKTSKGETTVDVSPVIVAAKFGNLPTMRKLLDGGKGTVEDRDEEGKTALLAASSGGHLSVVKELVNVYNVELFQMDENSKNAMHLAAEGGHIEVIKFLLPMFGERVHEKTNSSLTMLHWAAQKGHTQVACYLIKEVRMDPQDRDKWGHTALLTAVYGGSVPLVTALLDDYSSSVDELNENGMNAMHCAAQGGRIEVIKFLLPLFGERVNEKANTSYTMLHYAAQYGHCQVARYLIEEVHMDPQDRDKNGWNALHFAAYFGHLELVKYLIPILGEKTVTHTRETCLTLAIEQQNQDIVDYLIQEG